MWLLFVRSRAAASPHVGPVTGSMVRPPRAARFSKTVSVPHLAAAPSASHGASAIGSGGRLRARRDEGQRDGEGGNRRAPHREPFGTGD